MERHEWKESGIEEIKRESGVKRERKKGQTKCRKHKKERKEEEE